MAKYSRGGGRSKAWIGLAVLLLIALAAVVLLRYVFVVRNVSISGERNLPDETITRAAHINFGESIFAVDEREIRAGVNALGTIELDGVERRYPNTVLLSVHQRVQKAMLLYSGEIQILDSECCVIGSAPNVPDTDLIYVNGMTVTGFSAGEPLSAGKGQVSAYCNIMQALDVNSANAFVSEINLSDVNDLRLITRSGVTVVLGDEENMRDKIAWMRSAVADLEARGEGGGTLDVRSGTKADYSRPEGAVVATPAPVETAAPQG